MMSVMTVIPILVALAVSAGGRTGETTLGAGVTLKDSTSIDAILERPQEFVGKVIRVDGIATAVCTHKGCWMAVAREGAEKAGTVRLKVDDGVIVFPASAKGRKVSAEGVFEAVGRDQESREAAGEHRRQQPNASAGFQLKATGAIIR